jgi:putative ABC transport system ATP-binding protein
MAPLLQLIGGGRRPALTEEDPAAPWLWRGLDLDLQSGERLAVAGPSGSGKTLLLRTLAALDPLVEGEIRFQGRALAQWNIPEYRAAVLYLPQAAVLAEGTVEEALRFPFTFRVHGLAGRAYDRDRARRLLDSLTRGDLLDRQTGDLSGGEAQVVALVRALLLGPTVLLLDEPTASMDEGLAEAAERLVAEWLAEAGRAVIWTSHRGDRLERVTDRVVTLEGGRVP